MDNLDLNKLKWLLELFNPVLEEIQLRAEELASTGEYVHYPYSEKQFIISSRIDYLTEFLSTKISVLVKEELQKYKEYE